MKGIIFGEVIINPEQITLIIKGEAGEFTIHLTDGNKIPVTDTNGAIWKYFAGNCESIPGVEKVSSQIGQPR